MPTIPRGLAEANPGEVAARVDAAWVAFLDVARAADLAAPSRLPGWRAHDVCVHLGAWDDGGPGPAMLAAARAGVPPGPAPDPDAGNAALLAAHRDEPREAVLAALAQAREGTAATFAAPDLERLARHPVGTPVGPLPLASALHAVCYELAVHALDLAPAGAAAPDPDLLDAGLAALLDVTGSLAAGARLRITVSAVGDGRGWRFTSADGGWVTVPAVGPASDPHTAVRGRAADLLDVSAGRASVPALLATRRLVVDDLPTFLRLAPLIESVPHLPGGAALRQASRVLRTTGRLLGRVLPR